MIPGRNKNADKLVISGFIEIFLKIVSSLNLRYFDLEKIQVKWCSSDINEGVRWVPPHSPWGKLCSF